MPSQLMNSKSMFVTNIDQQKDVDQLLASEDITANHLVKLGNLALRALGEAIAWEVDEIPVAIYQEVIDEQRLTRCG